MLDVVQRMESLATLWGPSDRRSLFVNAYRLMSLSTLDAIEGGEFDDSAWVDRLLHRFADYYFDAVQGYSGEGGECPPVWKVAFDAAADEYVHPLRVLFLGINAHINYDLAFCLAEVMGDWNELDDGYRSSRRHDYHQVDNVIQHTVDSVQRSVVSPAAPEMGLIDLMLGPLDEWLFTRLIAGWRHDTWTDAVSILESGPTSVTEVIATIETRALGTAEKVLHVGPD